MIAKNLSIKDRYNFRTLKFDDEMNFKPKKAESIRSLLNSKNTSASPFSIIKYGLKNEVSAKTMEKDNTLIFICEVTATKPMIKAAIEELYGAKVVKVNTLIMFKKYAKKAFVKFAKEGDAVEVATKAGIL
jgi:large subunit ribosomal protein L23Ae